MASPRRREGTDTSTIAFAPMTEVSEQADGRENGPTNSSLPASSKQSWLWSPIFFICCSQVLSSWGDRMWTFAVGLYLVEIETTLRLTAVFGLVLATSVLLFGSLVGKWVDKYPRIKVVKVSLLVQNFSVVVCAAILALLLMVGVDTVKGVAAGWVYLACQILIIVFGDVANLAGMAEKISIQKDWVVVLAGQDKDLLAKINSVIRGIDQVVNVLAPIATGLIMTYGSLFLGAVAISGWNLVSGFAEYYMLTRVYRQVPALSVKMSKQAEEMKRRNDKRFTISDSDSEDDGNGDVYMEDVGVSEDVGSRAALYSGSMEEAVQEVEGGEEEEEDRLSLTPSEDERRISDKVQSRPMIYRIAYDEDEDYGSDSDNEEPPPAAGDGGQREELKNQAGTNTSSSPPAREEEEEEEGGSAAGRNLDSSPRVVRLEGGEEDVDSLELRMAQDLTCCQKLAGYFMGMYGGWITYMRYPVRYAGLGLSCLYMTVVGFNSVTTGYIYSQGISEAYISLARGFGSVTGLMGVFAFPRLRKRTGLEQTGLWAIGLEIACLTLCVASVWLPGSPLDLSAQPGDSNARTTPAPLGNTTLPYGLHTTLLGHTALEAGDAGPFQENVTGNYTTMATLVEATSVAATSHVTALYGQTTGLLAFNSTVSPEPEGESYSVVSVSVLLTGMVLSRFGLWMFDLTVTQIQQENVMESERGVVNGVQNSLNNFMDMLQFILVICLPTPQTFGILIILSFGFVFLGGCLYSYYSYKRGYLPFEKLVKKSESYHLAV